MGAVHSVASPVQLTVVVPSKGSKIVKSVFTTKSPAPQTSVKRYFKESVAPLLSAGSCGALLRTAVTLRGSSEEVDIENLNDDVAMYTQMGLLKVVFYTEQPDLIGADRMERTVFNSLVRERTLELPQWAHAGRPAVTQIFGILRRNMESEGLGFQGSADLKMGCEWMLGLSNILYRMSPFHGKLKARGCPIPDSFAFASGANDYKKKGKSEPLLTQELVREVTILRLSSLCVAYLVWALI